MFPEPIQKLIDIFAKFPSVGPKVASRFVFYILKLPTEKIDELIVAISHLKNEISVCTLCFNHFDAKKERCDFCYNPSRDKTSLCIIEKETDLISIEKIKRYKGLYFILGGTLSSLKKSDVEKLHIEQLKERIEKDTNIKEIIIAI